jgi:hypothetical protein
MAGALDDLGAARRRRNAAALSYEQLVVERGAQPVHGVADRRLIGAERFGSLRKRAELRHQAQGADGGKIDCERIPVLGHRVHPSWQGPIVTSKNSIRNIKSV